MLGEIEPLKALQDPSARGSIVERIVGEYPTLTLPPSEVVFRLRRHPKSPDVIGEYDTAPVSMEGTGRLDSSGFPVMYASQDLEVCVHECRVTVDDELYIATLRSTRDLRLLDLTEVLVEKERVTPFESLDMAVHLLFLAGSHSYEICRAIAAAAAAHGLDGIVYPSYFSLARTGAMPVESAYGLPIRIFPTAREHAKRLIIPNLAIFGRPISSGLAEVKSINKMILRRVAYELQFGPVGI